MLDIDRWIYGIQELNSSKHKLDKSKKFQSKSHVQPEEELNPKYPNTIRIAFRRGTHLEAMFWEASKFNAPPLTRPFSQQASRSFCNCSWSTSVLSWPVAMEYFGQVWQFNYSAAQDWYSCLAQQTWFFLLDKVDKMLFTGPLHSSTKLSPWRRSSQNTKRRWSSMVSGSHREVTHDLRNWIMNAAPRVLCAVLPTKL